MARKRRRPTDEPMTRFAKLVAAVICLEAVVFLWVAGAFRPLG